jgi:hypothetical protein
MRLESLGIAFNRGITTARTIARPDKINKAKFGVAIIINS